MFSIWHIHLVVNLINKTVWMEVRLKYSCDNRVNIRLTRSFYVGFQETELQDVIEKNTHLTLQNSDLQRRLSELERVRLHFLGTKCVSYYSTRAANPCMMIIKGLLELISPLFIAIYVNKPTFSLSHFSPLLSPMKTKYLNHTNKQYQVGCNISHRLF